MRHEKYIALFVTSRKMGSLTGETAVVDPRDPGTAPMPVTVKRSRGRPTKADALSQAERARRYRERNRSKVRGLVDRSYAKPADLAEKDRQIGMLVNERTRAYAEIERLQGLVRGDADAELLAEIDRLIRQVDVLKCGATKIQPSKQPRGARASELDAARSAGEKFILDQVAKMFRAMPKAARAEWSAWWSENMRRAK